VRSSYVPVPVRKTRSEIKVAENSFVFPSLWDLFSEFYFGRLSHEVLCTMCDVRIHKRLLLPRYVRRMRFIHSVLSIREFSIRAPHNSYRYEALDQSNSTLLRAAPTLRLPLVLAFKRVVNSVKTVST
jgi:hypothetical protein